MEYTYQGEPVRRPPKIPSPICTPSGSPISSSLSLAAVCNDACYNRNSYDGKCVKRVRSLSEPAHRHGNAMDHIEMNDIRNKSKCNRKPHSNAKPHACSHGHCDIHHGDTRQPNNITTSAVVTMPDFETVTIPNNIGHGPEHSTPNDRRRYDSSCNDKRHSPSHHTVI